MMHNFLLAVVIALITIGTVAGMLGSLIWPLIKLCEKFHGRKWEGMVMTLHITAWLTTVFFILLCLKEVKI